MPLEPKKLKSYLEFSKQKKMASMPNVLKKAGMPSMNAKAQHMEHEEEHELPPQSSHAKEAMKSAHKDGIAKPMEIKGKGSAKEAEAAMKSMARLIAEEIEEGEFDDDVMLLMEDFNPDSMPKWVLDKKTWKKAKKIVDPEGEGAEYQDPYAVIAHLYKKMGGKFKAEESNNEEEEEA